MYYERLVNIFRENNLQDLFPEISVNEFDQFIKKQIRNSSKFISPYKFAAEQDVTVKECVKFFIYFTGDNGIFDVLYYFDCSRPGCIGNRIYIDINDDLGERVMCEECGKPYSFNTYKSFIKVLFKMKNQIQVVDSGVRRIERNDPNSTFEALRELPPHLKLESPSSPIEIDEGDDEGVDLQTVIEVNNDTNGNPISNAVDRLKNKFMELNS